MAGPRFPRHPQRSPRGENYEPEDPEYTPMRRSSRAAEKQTFPTLRRVKSPKLESSKLIDPPKLPSIQEVRQKRYERAARNTKRWEYIKGEIDGKGTIIIVVLALVVVIRIALALNPDPSFRNLKIYDIDPSFSAVHNLTKTVTSHSTSQCLDLVLVRNSFTGLAQSFTTTASALPEGNTTHSTAVKTGTLAYAVKAADVSGASQTLFSSFLGINSHVISSLELILSEFSTAPIYNPTIHMLANNDHPRQVLPRQKVRRLLIGHLDELTSIVSAQRKEVIALISQLRQLDSQWDNLFLPIKDRKTDIARQIAQYRQDSWLRFPVGIFSIFDTRTEKLNHEVDALDVFFNPLDRNLVDQHTFEPFKVFWEQSSDRWDERNETRVKLGLNELLARLDVLHGDLIEVHKGLAGRNAFWRKALVADRSFEGVDVYSEFLAMLPKNLEAELAQRLQSCRNAFRREVKEYKKGHKPGWNSVDEVFPQVDLR